MNGIFLDRRNGSLALYLNGDLQFDARDERLYHEPLALVPVALAARRQPGRRLRVLILGGGDGLALREVLRSADVGEVHVVDRAPEVLRLGATDLADLNGGAFRDPRVRVHPRDARDFLRQARGFDAVVCDLTYPYDVEGAACYALPFFRRVRAALRPAGVLAVNAISPENTPQAFGCIGTTLGAAGLRALPYAFDLPSFRAQGYGRWGFFFAAPRAIGAGEIRRVRFPAGTALMPDGVLAGTRFPAAARAATRAAVNRADELLYYLYNPAPIAWEGPLRPLRFGPRDAAIAPPGPRLTAAEGFALWMRAPEGRRSLEGLLACLPLSQRGQTRQGILEWSHQADVLFRELDLGAFVEAALRRGRELPAAWRRDLTALRDRIRNGLPSADDLLRHGYRVFAVYLLVLLLANLFFPDNLYAKGFSTGGSHGASSGSSLNFSAPATRGTPYRTRYWTGGPYHSSWGPRLDRVPAADGSTYPARRLAFTDPQGGQRSVPPLLALTPELRLLETGAVAYEPAGVPGHQFLLEPGRLRVLDAAGREVVALLPDPRLEGQARRQIEAQGPLLAKAMADHRRWTDWVSWASLTAGGGEAGSEMHRLEAIRQAADAAGATWGPAAARPAFDPGRGWYPIFSGVFIEPPQLGARERRVALMGPDGALHPRSLEPPAVLREEDRFLFHVLNRRFVTGNDPFLKDVIQRWTQAYGSRLGDLWTPALAPTPGRRG